MSHFNIQYTCPRCDEDGLELPIEIDSPGEPMRNGGLPETSSPGCGAEWHIERDYEALVQCSECNALLTEEELDKLQEDDELNSLVQDREADRTDSSIEDSYVEDD